MERSVTMPKLGMTMAEGTMLRWLRRGGDLMEKGEPVVEVTTDKVNMEMEVSLTAHLTKIPANESETPFIGTPIAPVIDVSISPGSAPPTAPVTHTPLAPAPLAIASAQSSLPIASDSTSASSPSLGPFVSTPTAKLEGALYDIDLHAVVQGDATPPPKSTDVPAFVQYSTVSSRQEDTQQPVYITPLAQKMAMEHHLDMKTLTEVAAHNHRTKVTRADIETYLVAQPTKAFTICDTASPGSDLPMVEMPSTNGNEMSISTSGDELIPLSPVWGVIERRIMGSITPTPHIYLDIEIDMTEAERCCQQIEHSLPAQGESAPSLTAILVRATAAAWVLHSEVNARIEPGALVGKDVIRRWRAVHIGIAVDAEQTLLTPVIRNAHQQSLPSIAHELSRLTQAARQGALKPEELSDATFTISNLSMYGIDTFHTTIVPGQGAILAVGKTTKRPAVIDGEGERIEVRPMMRVSLSADHRVFNGAAGSRFLHRLKTLLENPYLLL